LSVTRQTSSRSGKVLLQKCPPRISDFDGGNVEFGYSVCLKSLG